jgi:hypothetical protein
MLRDSDDSGNGSLTRWGKYSMYFLYKTCEKKLKYPT